VRRARYKRWVRPTLLAASAGAWLALLISSGAATATGTQGLPPGVHLDPNSPAAKEYAIPLSQARAGGGTQGSSALFGSGIKRATNATVGTSRAGTSSEPTLGSTSGRSLRATPRTGHSTAARSRLSKLTAQDESAQLMTASGTGGGESGVVWMLGAAALVLVLGGVGAGALTARNRHTSASPG
jgi:hypothetical protein